MTDRSSLTLIVPGLGRELAQVEPAPAAAQLAQLAARGSLRHAWDRSDLAHGALCAWQRGLLWALQLTMPEHPSAALTALANDLEGDGDWLHAEPVHLVAGLNHLSLVELTGELQLSAQHRAACQAAVQEHLQACGYRLQVVQGGHWLIQTPQRLELTAVCPAAAAANELERAMPHGADAAALRRLMTELQMLLHEHPVNQQRAQQGLPAANSIWLWGNGRAAGSRQRLPQAFGAHAYLSGIYRHHASSLQPVPTSSSQLLAALESSGHQLAAESSRGRLAEGSSRRRLAVESSSQSLATAAARTQAVALLDPQPAEVFEQQWLVPMVQALRARRLARLELVLDSWHLSIDRRGLRRFWRRPLPPASWVA